MTIWKMKREPHYIIINLLAVDRKIIWIILNILSIQNLRICENNSW